MKQKIMNLLALFAIIFSMSACQLETSNNGKLDGYWHLVAVDSLDSGGKSDLSSRLLFWAIQGKILALYDRNDQYRDCVMHFTYRNDSLMLHNMLISSREDGDIVLTDTQNLSPFGINSLTEKYQVEVLNGTKLILKNNTYRLYFKLF